MRLFPDPYISIADDRRKGELLFRMSERMSYRELLQFYYSITPEVPPDHAARWTAHALAQPTIAEHTLEQCGMRGKSVGRLLDVGCSTGGLLIAVAGRAERAVGLDVAFRWLIVGRARLRELGISAELVCGNAEAMPFPPGSFDAVTAIDVLEHVRDPQACVSEAFRVSAPGASLVCATNNRYAPLRDPQVGVWGIGFLPRRWQPAYVARRRQGIRTYEVRMRSAVEMNRLFRRAGFRAFRTEPAPLAAPHVGSRILHRVLAIYNGIRRLPLIGGSLRFVGPRLVTIAER